MIDIAVLGGKTLEDIKVLIEGENTVEYLIYVPKSTQMYFSEISPTAYDYAYAAYSGQLLAGICDSFEYEQVPPEVHKSIGFTIKTHNKEALATTIMEISYLCVNDREDPEYIDIEDVNEFINKVENNGIVPACPYFMELFFDLVKEENEESEEG